MTLGRHPKCQGSITGPWQNPGLRRTAPEESRAGTSELWPRHSCPTFPAAVGCVGRRRGRKRKLQQQEPSLLAVNTVPPPKHRQAEGGKGRLGILWFGIWFPLTMRAQLRALRWAE